jgi:hypothetical protein
MRLVLVPRARRIFTARLVCQFEIGAHSLDLRFRSATATARTYLREVLLDCLIHERSVLEPALIV